jgi:KDO2-lipid IV(A) lauroyltransferase
MSNDPDQETKTSTRGPSEKSLGQTLWVQGPRWVGALVLGVLVHVVAVLPLAWAWRIGDGVGWFIGRVLRYRSRDVRRALQRAFPEASQPERARILKGIYRNFARTGVELMRLLGGRHRDLIERIRFEGWEHVEEALRQGRGLLLLTAHTGNWELAGAGLATRHPAMNVIAKEIKNALLDRWWRNTRIRLGMNPLPSRGSFRASLAALRDNQFVVFMLDQNMIDTEGIFVDFLNEPACTTPGLAYLAAVSRAPVVPGFSLRRGNTHLVRCYPLIQPPPRRDPDSIREATQHYTRVIEQVVRAEPEQWIWFHRRWRTKPPPAAGKNPD